MGFDLAPGEGREVPMRPMTLGEMRSAIECDIFGDGSDSDRNKAARARFGWEPMTCREALAWAKTPAGLEVQPHG